MRDELYQDAVRVVTDQQKCGTSLLQRHFRIGYARAVQLIDLLEEGGIIGPACPGPEPREVRFVCYHCRDGNCSQCVGVPCCCTCPIPAAPQGSLFA